jgi:hypothetical protein
MPEEDLTAMLLYIILLHINSTTDLCGLLKLIIIAYNYEISTAKKFPQLRNCCC